MACPERDGATRERLVRSSPDLPVNQTSQKARVLGKVWKFFPTPCGLKQASSIVHSGALHAERIAKRQTIPPMAA
jgi:hypothetical protein